MLNGELKPCRYRVGEMNCGAFFTIGHLTVAVPPNARFITLMTPNPADRTVRQTRLRVYRKNPRVKPADNDDDVAFLGIGDRAEVLDHPAFEPGEGLEPTKPDWQSESDAET